MDNTKLQALFPGNVLGHVTGRPNAGSREEWDAALEKVWPDFIAEMSTNPGYRGAVAVWTVESGEVSIIGVWESMAHRLAYEAHSSDKVRAIFNALLAEGRTRHKQVVTLAHWA